jgi:hypothetical protein
MAQASCVPAFYMCFYQVHFQWAHHNCMIYGSQCKVYTLFIHCKMTKSFYLTHLPLQKEKSCWIPLMWNLKKLSLKQTVEWWLPGTEVWKREREGKRRMSLWEEWFRQEESAWKSITQQGDPIFWKAAQCGLWWAQVLYGCQRLVVTTWLWWDSQRNPHWREPGREWPSLFHGMFSLSLLHQLPTPRITCPHFAWH